MRDVFCRADVATPHVVMEPWSGHDRAVLDGNSVRIESSSGEVLERRDDPRRFFPYGRRTFRWDDLDLAYFACYASWNYQILPALLLRDDITWKQISDTTLEARFPPEIPTHSPLQRFHFDAATGLLQQHDYTALVFASWARAANVVLELGVSDGIHYPSRRRVTPRRGDGQPRNFPLLVGIEIEDWRLVYDQDR